MEQDRLIKKIIAISRRIKKSSLSHRNNIHKNIPTFKPGDWKSFRAKGTSLNSKNVVRTLDNVDRFSDETWSLLHRLKAITGEVSNE